MKNQNYQKQDNPELQMGGWGITETDNKTHA